MTRSIIVITVLALLCVVAFSSSIDAKKVKSPKGDIAASWDWRNVNGINYVTETLNQNVPQYCSNGGIHAAVSSLADRIKISRGAAWPDYRPSVQFFMNCAWFSGDCSTYYSPKDINNFFQANPIPDVTCLPYDASNNNPCAYPINHCRRCVGQSISADGNSTCLAQPTYNAYHADEVGQIGAGKVKAIMREIQTRGPVSATISQAGLVNYTGGILQAPSSTIVDHVVSLAGWGTENGVDYWIVRNSWGTYWGEQGWARIQRGVNALGIENQIFWATPLPVTQ